MVPQKYQQNLDKRLLGSLMTATVHPACVTPARRHNTAVCINIPYVWYLNLLSM
jgi:hypothetical protein